MIKITKRKIEKKGIVTVEKAEFECRGKQGTFIREGNKYELRYPCSLYCNNFNDFSTSFQFLLSDENQITNYMEGLYEVANEFGVKKVPVSLEENYIKRTNLNIETIDGIPVDTFGVNIINFVKYAMNNNISGILIIQNDKAYKGSKSINNGKILKGSIDYTEEIQRNIELYKTKDGGVNYGVKLKYYDNTVECCIFPSLNVAVIGKKAITKVKSIVRTNYMIVRNGFTDTEIKFYGSYLDGDDKIFEKDLYNITFD